MISCTLKQLEDELQVMRSLGATDITRVFVKRDEDSPIDINELYLDEDNDIIINHD